MISSDRVVGRLLTYWPQNFGLDCSSQSVAVSNAIKLILRKANPNSRAWTYPLIVNREQYKHTSPVGSIGGLNGAKAAINGSTAPGRPY